MKKKMFDGLASEAEAKFWPMPLMTESVADYISRAFLPVPMTDRGEIVRKGMELNGEVVGEILVSDLGCYDVYNLEGDSIAECMPREKRIKA